MRDNSRKDSRVKLGSLGMYGHKKKGDLVTENEREQIDVQSVDMRRKESFCRK